MKTKHTQGEWVLCSEYIVAETKSPQSSTIESSIPIVKMHYNGDDEQYEANARLIAAAPDLLEAAILCNKEFDDPNDAKKAFGKLTEAIKKATA